MAWYRTGTVTVTQGSATIVGVGTDFVSNAVMGDGFRGPDGRTCEIARVVSATELTLAEGYAGPSAGGQPYVIQPTQSYLRDLAQSAATLLATFGAVRDGIGQGLISDGTVAAPGVRFASDPDTGIFRAGVNAVGIAAGGSGGLVVGADNIVPAGKISMGYRQAVGLLPQSEVWQVGDSSAATYGVTFGVNVGGGAPATVIAGFGAMIIGTGNIEQARFDQNGNLLVGTNAGTCHTIRKGNTQGDPTLEIFAAGRFYVGAGALWNGAATVFGMVSNTTTGRSISASGTINASGADYAEYMVKAAGCGTIAPGDVCGVDVDGRLTRTWADAVSFVVKSTDPAYVGGDTWAAAMAPRPEQPGAEPIEPATPPAAPADDAELGSWREIVDAYPAALASWRADHTTWEAATAAYQRDLAAWEAELETARVKVDRIAFCGQVPVNVAGEFAVGDYLIAAPAGAGIKAVAIGEADITFDQYRRRLGKVWAVRDGRAWIDVQHG